MRSAVAASRTGRQRRRLLGKTDEIVMAAVAVGRRADKALREFWEAVDEVVKARDGLMEEEHEN